MRLDARGRTTASVATESVAAATSQRRHAAGSPLTRRDLLKAAVVAPLGAVTTPAPAHAATSPAKGGARRVVVVGAGAFGGWTALALRRRGAEVTLVDAWGPGNSRASSGGETRVIRGMYGADQLYTDWVVRSFALWREHESRCGDALYHPTGVLWMFSADDSYARSSLPLLREAGLPVEELDLAAARRRYPQVDFTGVDSAFVEAQAGYLTARRACQSVVRSLVAEGGSYVEAAVRAPLILDRPIERLELSDGSTASGDAYVFACGPWLGALFPDVVGQRIAPTRQEVFYFGPPAADPRFREGAMPIWIDFADEIFYGIPGNEHRGFKVADDTRGEPLDPTSAERTPTSGQLERARRTLARRFPALADSPVLGAEVCQYENTPDGHFLIDRHPAAENAWIVGGGSGHGFKLGPAVGEHVAALVAGEGQPRQQFALGRLAAVPAVPRTQFKRRDG
jgi:sarcosine oxidase